MGVPAVDIAFSRKPVAMFLNPSNELSFFQVEPHIGKFFVHQKYGVFELDSGASCRTGKTPIYFYYSEYPKPIHLKYYGMLHNWAKKNGIDKVRKRDLKHSSLFERFKAHHKGSPIEAVREYEDKNRERIRGEIDKVNSKLTEENERRLQNGEGPVSIDPVDYAGYVIDKLLVENLITAEDAANLKFKLTKGEVTIEDFITKLDELNAVQIINPVPLNPRMWMEEIQSYKPSEVFSYIKATRNLDKKIEKLGLKQVRNLIPAAWIFIVVLGVCIGLAVLLTTGAAQQIGHFLHLN